MLTRSTAADLFWTHVDMSGECWLWTGFCEPRNGYGKCRAVGEQLAHRVSWVLANGPVPIDMKVLHTCDNPPCVKPDHLWLGSFADNNRDRESKGRGFHPAGVRAVHAKLTAEQVLEIRGRSDRQPQLAKMFNVSLHTIWRIKNNKTYQDV